MKRIIIVCEGPTEQEFCKDVLQSHFNPIEIYLHFPIIKKSGGGIVAWGVLKKQIENHLRQEAEALVTTLIDYYGILAKHQFPGWDAASKIIDKNAKMDMLESCMKNSIHSDINNRFIPYIQLHEFEGLLFNDINIFNDNFHQQDFIDKPELEKTINDYPNSEFINDTAENSPSYRLKRMIKGYNKIVYGAILAQSIGLLKIRNKSPRFNNWIKSLENS
jgi:hypothetical protein